MGTSGRMSSDQIILLVYIVLLELGGLMGFLKAGSKASLIASSIFAAVLVLFVFNILPIGYAWVVLAFLLVFFAKRLIRSKKMMPNGMMVILSLLALILLQVF
jgi:uncharacterized membrane protein (UPF0136 family)